MLQSSSINISKNYLRYLKLCLIKKVKPNVNEAPTHDAQLAAENIASGEEKAPSVDFDADYATAQQFSVSEIDRTGEGAAAAKAATAPKHEVSQSKETKTEATVNW